MKNITFKHKTSQKLYNNYIKRIKKITTILSKEDREDILMEFNSHIYESIQNKNEQPEIEKLVDILDKLGNPETVLKPTIADKKLAQATKTFNPIHVFKAITLNIANGISFIFFAILYLLLIGFGFLIVQKIIHPNEIGLFFEKGKFVILGSSTNLNNATEVLGNWFIPTMIISAVILYFTITLLLKIKEKIKK